MLWKNYLLYAPLNMNQLIRLNPYSYAFPVFDGEKTVARTDTLKQTHTIGLMQVAMIFLLTPKRSGSASVSSIQDNMALANLSSSGIFLSNRILLTPSTAQDKKAIATEPASDGERKKRKRTNWRPIR